MTVTVSEKVKESILNGSPLVDGRIPFDTLTIRKDGGYIRVSYYFKGEEMFWQQVASNLGAGDIVALPDHIGTVGFTLS